MKERLLAVDTDVERFTTQQEAWKKHRVNLVRASSMEEAVELAGKERFMAIGINADKIDYEPFLKILRDATDASIHVLSSQYDNNMHVNACILGANVFSIWCEDAETHVHRGLAQIHRHFENMNLPHKQAVVIGIEDLRVYPDYYLVTVRGKEVDLRPKEFQILMYLMANRGRIMQYEQILDQIWGDDYNGSFKQIYDHVGRLCRKLEAIPGEHQYIECRKGVGYRFLTADDHI